MTATTDRYAEFRQLHQSGCFVIPNPWDAGSARLLVQLGFKAVATTSTGFAWSSGLSDHHVTLAHTLAHLRTIAAAVPVPVSADFEGGYAVAPDDVATNVAAAAATGIAGLSIEDSTHDPAAPLYEFELAVARIRAARGAIDRVAPGLVLTGRSEGFIAGRPDMAETIRRLTAYIEAGADCVFAPGIRNRDQVATIVKAVAPTPVNVLVSGDWTTVADLADLGVRRISVGGTLARTAWTGVISAATEIAEHGTFTGFMGHTPFDQLEKRFGE